MSSYYDSIRIDNLQRLIAKHGSQKKFADATGKNASFISQILSGHRTMGERSARQIETALGLELYSMDKENGVANDTPIEPRCTLKSYAEKAARSLEALREQLPTDDEYNLLLLYRAASSEAQAVIMSVAKAQSKH